MSRTPAGRRDRRIRFVRPVMDTEALGGEREIGTTLIEEAYAAVRYGTSQERREAAASNASQVATFRCVSTNKLRGVLVMDRIVFEDVEYNISGIATIDGPATEIEFTATASKG